MKTPHFTATQLEDLPNIGPRIAADLRALGISSPMSLAREVPLDVFNRLRPIMGRRHDPCVLYVLLSAQHFQTKNEVKPWWSFTQTGKKLIEKNKKI
jgi:hypothetical protein